MHRASITAACVAVLAAATAMAAERSQGPGLGQPASASAIAAADISISPDGAGLPPGQGSVARGAEVFAGKCQSCHGAAGKGGPMDQLTGGIGSLPSPQPIKTVASYWPYATTVFDYVRRAMPLQAPQTLSDEEVYSVVAYLLSVDGIVPPDAVLDARSLPLVRMPNREGFESKAPAAR